MPYKIICVRIAQRILNNAAPYTHFPYDRVYLTRKKTMPKLRRLFRYYLAMDLDRDLLKALNALSVSNIKESPIQRDDYRTEGKDGNRNNNFKSLVKDPKGWVMLIPTHVRSKYKDPKKRKNPYASELRYILSNAITANHNTAVKMPRISFYTPSKVIPVFCTMCKKLPAFHAGDCTPGRPSCKQIADVQLKLDSDNRNTSIKSVNETGDLQ